MIDFDSEELEAAGHWHGGQSSMLYAIVSTGALSRGTTRPQIDDRPMTDTEWMRDLAERLESEADSASDAAHDRLQTCDENEHDELLADREGLLSIVEKCREFLTRTEPYVAVDATMPRYSDGELCRYTSVGCYPLVYRCADGGTICPACANGRNGSEACAYHEAKQWRLIGCDVYWEGPPMQCDHCNAEIESAYGDPDATPSLPQQSTTKGV